MLHRTAIYALMICACTFLCASCTESDDGTAAMAESISNVSDGDLVLAGMAPVPGAKALPVDMDVDFVSAAAPASVDDDALLSFAVKCDKTGTETITMTDPKTVENASIELEFCKLDVKPTIRSAKTAGNDACKANGGFCVNLFDTSGKMMGAFEISETGSMSLATCSKLTSYKPMLNFSGENIDGEKLDRFMVYPKGLKPGDVYEPVMAIEYRHAAEATEHEFDAPDGYSYTYAFHGGTLRVYPAEALAELADQAASDTRAAAKGGGGSLGIGGACASTSSGGGGG